MLDAAERSYRPRAIARALAAGRTNTLRASIPFTGPDLLLNPFFQAVAARASLAGARPRLCFLYVPPDAAGESIAARRPRRRPCSCPRARPLRSHGARASSAVRQHGPLRLGSDARWTPGRQEMHDASARPLTASGYERPRSSRPRRRHGDSGVRAFPRARGEASIVDCRRTCPSGTATRPRSRPCRTRSRVRTLVCLGTGSPSDPRPRGPRAPRPGRWASACEQRRRRAQGDSRPWR